MMGIRRWGALAMGGAVLVLAGCAHLWAPPAPTVIFGPPVVQGERGELVVSVADIPQGAGALAVELGGLVYPADKLADLEVEGLNGFVVLAQRFEAGQGGFVLASISGIEAGPIARITFRALAPVDPGDFTVDGAKVSLADEHNEPVEFTLSRPAYYAR
jgi:hypothetical protein